MQRIEDPDQSGSVDQASCHDCYGMHAMSYQQLFPRQSKVVPYNNYCLGIQSSRKHVKKLFSSGDR